MDNTTRVKVGLTIWQRPGYGPRKRLGLGQISGKTRGYASARAKFRPDKEFRQCYIGQISGQRRAFANARANFRPDKRFPQC